MAADVLGGDRERAVRAEERGGMQSSRPLESGLLLTQRRRQTAHHVRGNLLARRQRFGANGQRFDRRPPADAARGARRHVPALRHELPGSFARAAHQKDVDDVVRLAVIGMAAVFDRADVRRALDHSFGEKKAGRQFAIAARRPHDDREGTIVQPYFQRLFDRRRVHRLRDAVLGHSHDANRPRLRHDS